MSVATSQELREALARARALLTRIHHDVNNPLSVLSGNAQLLQELARALQVESEFTDPLTDMEQAVDGLSESIDRLMVVRKLLSELEDRLGD